MPDRKLTSVSALGEQPAATDLLFMYDVSDTSADDAGTPKPVAYGDAVPYRTGGTDVAVADGGTGSSTAAGARTNLGLVIGTNVQAWSAVLDATTASFTTADETKLDGIESGATADQSAAEILAALLTVDGAGSGLDADLLDGQSSAAFQPADSDLTAIAALSTTSYGRALLELANQAALTALIAAASESATGAVELATTAEAAAGTDTVRAVTPAGVKAVADLKLSLAANGSSVENIGAVESNVNTVASSGSTETLDTSVYGVHDVTMSENCTFTFSNPAPSGKCTIFTLVLRGAFTPTWPASVDWPDATQPTYGTPTVYTFMTVDAGATWLGASAGKAFG